MSITSPHRLPALALLSLGALAACDDPPTYPACGSEPLAESEMEDLVTSTAYVAGTYVEEGRSTNVALFSFFYTLAMNGIDFAAPGFELEPPTDGTFWLRNGDARIGLRLAWAEDGEGHAAGDPLLRDLMDQDSWVADVDVELEGGELVWSFEPGPLWELIDGEIEVVDDDPLHATVRFSVRADLITAAIVTEQDYSGFIAPWEEATFHYRLASVPERISDIAARYDEAGFGLEFDETRFVAPHVDLVQEFSESSFLATREGDKVHFGGSYTASVAIGGRQLYHHGALSSRTNNRVDFACDPEGSDRVGRLTLATSRRQGRYENLDGDGFNVYFKPLR